MSLYAIRFKKDNRVRYFSPTQGDPEYNGIDLATLETAKTWKTEKGAKKYLETHLFIGRAGERLRVMWTDIEVVEISSQQQWHTNNPELIRESKAKYDVKHPVFSFRPKPEILQWLEKERLPNETDAKLLNRKLEELMQLQIVVEQHD